MATYEEIYGKRVDVLSSDPSLTSVNEGQVWYNSTTGTLKSVVLLQAWSSGSPTIYAQGEGAGGAGTQTAALIAGGSIPEVATSGEYNGSGWTAGGSMNTAGGYRGLGGTQTAAFAFGNQVNSPDNPSGASETYNGTAWTSITSNPQSTSQNASFGTTTAGVCAAGRTSNMDAATTTTNEWDGSSWTSGGAYPAQIRIMAVTSTAPATTGLTFGGRTGGAPSPGDVTSCQSYDGSTWTSQTAIPTATHAAGGSGTSASALMFGGNNPSSATANSFKYDGTSWASSPAMGTARRNPFGLGSTTAALCAGGSSAPGADLSVTEEFHDSVNTVTAAAWAAGNNMVQGRRGVEQAGCGTQTAALVAGGNSSHPGTTLLNNSEEYDGTSWAEGNNLTTARTGGAGAGTQTAGLCIAGFTGSYPEVAIVEEYDGTSWTESGDLSTARQLGTGGGIQTAAIFAGGRAGSPTTYYANSEYFDGSSWTNAPSNMPTSRSDGAGAGTQTAFIMVGGVIPPGPPFSETKTSTEWDGSSWTAGGAYPLGQTAYGGSGTQTASIFYGGNPNVAAANGYDGTSFSTRPSMATGRTGLATLHGGSSSATAALGAAGTTGSVTAATEEFTGETETATASTLTTS